MSVPYHDAPPSSRPSPSPTGPRRRLDVRLATAALLTLVVAACERQQSVPAIDSSVPLSPAPVTPVTPAGSSTWDPRLGPVLLIATSDPTLATIVIGDSAKSGADTVTAREAIAIRSAPATLVGHGPAAQLALLKEVRSTRGDDAPECTGWPTWRIAPANNDAPIAPWSVGFVGASVTPVALDSIENMSRPDSARLAAEVTRLASTLPSAAADRLAGLPFTVTSLWRFAAAPRAEGIAASLVRRVNQEARPLEERTLIIAERDSSSRDARLILSYYDRSQGAEETVESREVLALARRALRAQPMLVLAQDFGDGRSYSLVERDPSGRWREQWRSSRGRCR